MTFAKGPLPSFLTTYQVSSHMCVHFALDVICNMRQEYHEHLLDGREKGRCCYGAEERGEALKGTKKFNAAAFSLFLHPPLSFWRRRPNFDLRTYVHMYTETRRICV